MRDRALDEEPLPDCEELLPEVEDLGWEHVHEVDEPLPDGEEPLSGDDTKPLVVLERLVVHPVTNQVMTFNADTGSASWGASVAERMGNEKEEASNDEEEEQIVLHPVTKEPVRFNPKTGLFNNEDLMGMMEEID